MGGEVGWAVNWGLKLPQLPTKLKLKLKLNLKIQDYNNGSTSNVGILTSIIVLLWFWLLSLALFWSIIVHLTVLGALQLWEYDLAQFKEPVQTKHEIDHLVTGPLAFKL